MSSNTKKYNIMIGVGHADHEIQTYYKNCSHFYYPYDNLLSPKLTLSTVTVDKSPAKQEPNTPFLGVN